MIKLFEYFFLDVWRMVKLSNLNVCKVWIDISFQ